MGVGGTAAGAGFHDRSVSDRGLGVPEAEREAIFEPFYRGQNGPASPGFGLGLSITKRAFKLHWGRIDAVNRGAWRACR
jgi:two-component system, OmpR family, sensor kinase